MTSPLATEARSFQNLRELARLQNTEKFAPELFELADPQQKQRVLSLLSKHVVARLSLRSVDQLSSHIESSAKMAQLKQAKTEQTIILNALSLGILRDDYRNQLIEWYKVSGQAVGMTEVQIEESIDSNQEDSFLNGTVVYYPDSETFVHILSEDRFWDVFTSRNYPVVSKETQHKLRSLEVIIIGSSVGGKVAKMLVNMGVGKIKIFDAGKSSLEKTPLLDSSIDELGHYKTDVIQTAILHQNPYVAIEADASFVTPDQLSGILGHATVSGSKKLVIEAVDNPVMKFAIQEYCALAGIQVLAPTDLGFGTVVENMNTGAFGNRMSREQLQATLEAMKLMLPSQAMETMMNIILTAIGPDNIPPHMLRAASIVAAENIPYLPQPAVAAQLMSATVMAMITEWLETGTMPNLKKVDLFSV